jgi:nucleotide-binding universal stress UspA family protein
MGIEPELVIREGKPAEEIHKLIEEDQDIAILVLAAGMGKEGPGPLVGSMAGKGAASPSPSPSCRRTCRTRILRISPETPI